MAQRRILLVALANVGIGIGMFTTSASAGIWPNGPQGNGIQGNGIQGNGIQGNGIQGNGIQGNGIQGNGIQGNGIQGNGIQGNGVMTSGVSYDGLGVVGTQISFIGRGSSVYPYTCGHREDATGAALNNCSPCSRIVGDADAYCRGSYWDGLCVNQAKEMCGLGAGTVMNASFTDGRVVKMRIGTTTQGSSSFWNGSKYVDMSDVTYNTVYWVLDHAPNVTGVKLLPGMNSCVEKVCNIGGNGYSADPYCCNNYWDSICVNKANNMCGVDGVVASSSTAGASVCGTTGLRRAPVQAVFLSGVWDQHWGQEGNGAKTASDSMFTIACRGRGAYAKCLDMGYKPWQSAQHDLMHQTCVRAVRADYCGDGSSFTTDGRQIDVSDYLAGGASTSDDIQINSNSSGFNYEATWDSNGARCLEYPAARANGGFNAYNGQTFNEYYNARNGYGDPSVNYCYVEPPGSGASCWNMSASTGLISNETYWE